MKLADRVAIVTGAARGIGREIALTLVREGAKVTICDIDIEPLNDVANEIKAAGMTHGYIIPGIFIPPVSLAISSDTISWDFTNASFTAANIRS